MPIDILTNTEELEEDLQTFEPTIELEEPTAQQVTPPQEDALLYQDVEVQPIVPENVALTPEQEQYQRDLDERANNVDTYIDQYELTPQFVEDTDNTRLDALKDIYNNNEALFVDNTDNDDRLAARADQFKRLSGKKATFDDVKHYFPQFPDLGGLEEGEQLSILDEWNQRAEVQGALLAKQEGRYADYLVDRNDFLDIKDEIVAATRRKIKGKDTGYVSDKLERVAEGGLSFFTQVFGADDATAAIQDYFTENPEYDDTIAAQVAYGLGQGSAQMLTAVGLAGATVATGGGAAAVAGVAGAGMFSANISLNYQDAYAQIYEETGDAERATHGAIMSALPASVVETVGDMVIGSGYIKSVGKKFLKGAAREGVKKATKSEWADLLVEGTKNVSKAAAKGGFTEAMIEPIQGALMRRGVNIAVGDEITKPFDRKLLTQEAVVGGAVGAILGGVGGGVETLAGRQQGLTPQVVEEYTDALQRSPIDTAIAKAREDNTAAPTGDTPPPPPTQLNENPYERQYQAFNEKEVARHARDVAKNKTVEDELLDVPTTPELSPEELEQQKQEKITQTIEGAREEVTELAEAVKAQQAISVIDQTDVDITQATLDNKLEDIAGKTGLTPEQVKSDLGIVVEEVTIPEVSPEDAAELTALQDKETLTEIEQGRLDELTSKQPTATYTPAALKAGAAINQAKAVVGDRQSKVLKTHIERGVLPGRVLDHIIENGGLLKSKAARAIKDLDYEAQGIIEAHGFEGVIDAVENRSGKAWDDVDQLYPNTKVALGFSLVHNYLEPKSRELAATGDLSGEAAINDTITNITQNIITEEASKGAATVGAMAHMYDKYAGLKQSFVGSLEDQVKHSKAPESKALTDLRAQLRNTQEELDALKSNIVAEQHIASADTAIKDYIDKQITDTEALLKKAEREKSEVEAELKALKKQMESKSIRKPADVKAAEKQFNKAKKELEDSPPPDEYMLKEDASISIQDDIRDLEAKKIRLQERLKQENAILSPEDKAAFNDSIKEYSDEIAIKQEALEYLFKDPAEEAANVVTGYTTRLRTERKSIKKQLKDNNCV